MTVLVKAWRAHDGRKRRDEDASVCTFLGPLHKVPHDESEEDASYGRSYL